MRSCRQTLLLELRKKRRRRKKKRRKNQKRIRLHHLRHLDNEVGAHLEAHKLPLHLLELLVQLHGQRRRAEAEPGEQPVKQLAEDVPVRPAEGLLSRQSPQPSEETLS
jgi:hypothetical protein